jgi:hypothetical protein
LAEIINIRTGLVGDGRKLSPASVLDAARAADLSTVVVIGYEQDGSLYAASTDGTGDCLLLIERAKQLIVFGDR